MGKTQAARLGLPQPTDAELAILRVLWGEGPSTVRQVHDILDRREPTGYTTVLKILQIMHQKGLVQRDDSERAHVYTPTLSKEQTQRQYVKNFTRRVFDGSATELVLQALGSTRPASRAELERIRELLDQLEEKRR